MEMCWQEFDDRPSAEDILAFLQQIDEESTMQQNSPKHHVQRQKSSDSDKIVQNGPTSPTHGFSTTILSPKAGKHSTRHVAEVLVHRVDDSDFMTRNNETDVGFEDDFSKIKIQKNQNGAGFEDNFVHCDDSDLTQNDSILAYGGNASETNDIDESDRFKHITSTDPNMNLLTEPIPVVMSTPSKHAGSDQLNIPSRTNQSESYNTALSNPGSRNTSAQFQTAIDTNSYSSGIPRSILDGEINSKHSSENQNDEGYRTDTNRTPDIIVSTNQTDHFDREHEGSQDDVQDENRLGVNDSQRTSDLETERAKEIYITKGAALPPSSLHKSRSLGTIPEDGIPSDNTSQSGVVFDENTNEEIGMGFEWDDYIGEELVGRVRYMSDESPRANEEFTEWTFDPDSGSEASNSKAGSIASESDGEVKRHISTTIDTRAYIANILTNRLNNLARQTTNPSYLDNSSFYSFSQYEDSYENASSGSESPPFTSMPPIAENPNDHEIPDNDNEHDSDHKNHFPISRSSDDYDLEHVPPIPTSRNANNDLKQAHVYNDLQKDSSNSMLSHTNKSENLDLAALDLEPQPDLSMAPPAAAEDKSVDSLKLEEEFVWVDNQESQEQVTML